MQLSVNESTLQRKKLIEGSSEGNSLTSDQSTKLNTSDDDTNASVTATIINMTNNVLDFGLVSYAYYMSKCSLVPGVLIMILLATIACFSQIIITRTCRLTNKYTYKELGEETFGKIGGYTISIIVLLYTLGSCISCFIVIGDIFIETFIVLFPSTPILYNRALIVGLISIIIIFPLCMTKTINSVRYVSALSILFTFITISIIFTEFVTYPMVSSTVQIFNITSNFFTIIPILCLSFNCHYNVPRYYYELKKRSPGRMWMTAIGSSSLLLFIYLTLSVSGYLLFGTSTFDDILLNFDHESILPTIARITLGCSLICHVPTVYFAVRSTISSLFNALHDFYSMKTRLIIAVGVLLTTVIIAITMTKIQVIMSLLGSLLGSLIMFVIPGMMYLKAARNETGVKRKKWEAWFILIFGILVCITGTAVNIHDLIYEN